MIAVFVALACTCLAATQAAAEPVHAIAMHGEPRHPAGFNKFDAVNPKASKGGRLIQGIVGSFDSTNPFIVMGTTMAGVRDNVAESLLTRGLDEPFTLYGLLAQSIELPDDRSRVTFNINPKATFSDGRPVTSDDVLFSFNVLREKGRPNHLGYFKKVTSAERLSDLSVRFVFDASGDRELPLILGLMPVFPSHVFKADNFEKTMLTPFVGSGPYTMTRIEPGRSVTYTRNPAYWGRDLAVNRGRYNFDELRFDYYRDDNVMFEAFKNGELNVRLEDNPTAWSQGYAFPAVLDGQILKAELETAQPAGMSGLVFNTRRPVFADQAVRRALIEVFDFEFANKTLFNGLYKRTQSYFERSTLSSVGIPADAEERRLLAPFPDAVKPDVMAGTARMPQSDGSGRNRAALSKAIALLTQAGFKSAGGKLLSPTGQPLAFEMLVGQGAQVRLLTGFKSDLEKIGIAMSIRQVDSSQYAARLRTYDYDMIQTTWPSSLSPGNEQSFRWSGASGKQDGSFNFAGVANPAADAMIQAMLASASPAAFMSAVRALDRVLLSGDYVIPLYHVPRLWLAHTRNIKYPPQLPLAGLATDVWWSDVN